MAPLRIDMVTIFPALVEAALGTGIPRIAAEKGLVTYHPLDLREFTTDRHRSVDDRPYGGGPGMVMRPEPVFAAVEALNRIQSCDPVQPILLSPQGEVFDQAMAHELAGARRLTFVCGRYEGFDERIRTGLQPREISLGDFVLSGGELAVAVIVDAIVRLLPGALGHEDSAAAESFGESGILDHPHYTRPVTYRGMTVPEVLLSGDHAAIARWRHEQALARTRLNRADLISDLNETSEERNDGQEEPQSPP